MKSETLYLKVYNDIIGKIKNASLKPGDKLPTEMELTGIYNVSRITISRALKELENINLIYRIKKSGTFINGASRQKTKQKIIPIILPFQEDTNGVLIESAQNCALFNNAFTPVFNSKNNSKKEREILLSIFDMHIDGLIIYPCSNFDNIDLFSQLKIKKIPFIFLDRCVEGIAAPILTSDNENGMYILVNRLLDLGHEKIAFFAVNNNMISTEKERFQGYCNALIDRNLPVDNRFIFRVDNLHEKETDLGQRKQENLFTDICERLVRQYLAMPQKPTAICCVNDVCAFTLIELLQNFGKNVPVDVSVTGFDNLTSTLKCTPTITTVAQNFKKLGEAAIESVLNLIDEVPNTLHYRIATDVIERESTRNLV